MKKIIKSVLGTAIAVAMILGTISVMPHKEVYAAPNEYERAELTVGTKLYPGDVITFEENTCIVKDFYSNGIFTETVNASATFDHEITLDSVEGYDSWIVVKNQDKDIDDPPYRNTTKYFKLVAAKTTDTVTLPCCLFDGEDIQFEGEAIIKLSETVNLYQTPLEIFEDGGFYGDSIYVVKGFSNSDMTENYPEYIAPEYEFDDIYLFSNFSITLAYGESRELSAKITVDIPSGMDIAKVYKYDFTNNEFVYLGLCEDGKVTFDCLNVESGLDLTGGAHDLFGYGGYLAFLEMKDYSFTEESCGQTYTIGKDDSLKLTADADFAKFESVEVDGTVIAAENYTANSGSTIVELKKEYMDKLSVGEHTVTVNWVDGSASTGVTINANGGSEPGDDNESKDDIGAGDNFNVVVAAIFIIAAVGLMTISIRKKQIEN
ncbi:MAG: hypothetical protein ACI4EW_09270 [Butyrivibrio sp.]